MVTKDRIRIMLPILEVQRDSDPERVQHTYTRQLWRWRKNNTGSTHLAVIAAIVYQETKNT